MMRFRQVLAPMILFTMVGTGWSHAATCSSILGIDKPNIWSKPKPMAAVIVDGKPNLKLVCTNDFGEEIRDFHVRAKSLAGGGVSQVFKKVNMKDTEPFKNGRISSTRPGGKPEFLNNAAHVWSPPKKGEGAAPGTMIKLYVELFGDKQYAYKFQATTSGSKLPVNPVPVPAAGLLFVSGLSLLGLARFARASGGRPGRHSG